MSALDEMTAELTARLMGRLRPLGVEAAGVAQAVAEALAGCDWARLQDGFVKADAAAQAYRAAWLGDAPDGLDALAAAWTGARQAQSPINGSGLQEIEQ